MYLVNEKFLKEHNDFTIFGSMRFKSDGFSAKTISKNDFEGKNLNYKVKEDKNYFTSVMNNGELGCLKFVG